MLITLSFLASFFLSRLACFLTKTPTLTIRKIIILWEISVILLIYLFHHLFPLPESIYLLSLWLVSFTLSLTDYLSLMVEPFILYPFALITFIFFVSYQPFNLVHFILPCGIYIFFCCLDMFMSDSIGGGDIKLLMIYGFFLSFQQILYLILISSISGLLFILLVHITTGKRVDKLPFVPFLTLGLILATLWIN